MRFASKNQKPVLTEPSSPENAKNHLSESLWRVPDESWHRLSPPSMAQGVNATELLARLNAIGAGSPWGSEPGRNPHLIALVDEFLETGISEDGVETPADRSLRRTRFAKMATFDYPESGRISFLPSDNGGLELFFNSCQDLDNLRRTASSNEDYAREDFIFLMQTKLRFTLAKCRQSGCGRYFILKHVKRSYKRGTVCRNCSRQFSNGQAETSTRQRRKIAEGTLHKLVAQRYRREIALKTSWQQDQKLRSKIITFLNAEIERSEKLAKAYPAGITGKWLSWTKNQRGIESRARELNR